MNRANCFLRQAVALVAGAVLLVLTGHAMAQNGSDNLPPHVIDVWPYPGEEVAPSQAISITFDQPMERASVEAAWHIDPAVPITFTWQDDRTLDVLPEEGWTRATRYIITIDVTAQAANGLALEETYKSFVQTVGYLDVSTVIPAPDVEGVTADATITVAFNRPVVPLLSTEEQTALPSPITIEPALEGTGDWVNTSIYVFTPSKPLAGGTTFTVIVNAGLTDVTGAVLRSDYSWQFKTLPPEILNISPWQNQENVPLESTVSVQFSQPMDPTSTESAFALLYRGDKVPGTFTWSDQDRWLTFTPASRLEIESAYTISVAPTARSTSGEATLATGLTYNFSTAPYPGIQSTSPSNGEREVYPGGGVTFYFKSAMNTATFEGKVEFVKPEHVEWEPVVGSSSTFYVQFSTQPETEYVIRFKRGAEDIYGNTIDTDYTLTFTTSALEPRAYLPAQQQFMITNGYREDTRVAVSVTADPTAAFTLYRVETDQIGGLLTGSNDDLRRVLLPANLIRTWAEKLDAAPFLQGVDEIRLASEGGGQLPPGVYYLQMLAPNMGYPQALTLGVVTANLTVKRAPDELLIWVTDLETSAPLADMPVTVYTYAGRAVASDTTDQDGVVHISAANIPTDSLYVVAEGPDGYGVWMSWGANTLPDVNGYLYTDRPIYRPGQTVYFRGALRDREDMTYTLPRAEKVHVTINVNWGAQALFEGDLPLTEFGTFSGELVLPEDAPIGDGQIVARYRHDYDASINFTIAEFRVPEYKVEVTPDYPEIVQGDDLQAVIAASYYFGGAVSDSTLNWNALGEIAWFNYIGPGRYTFTDDTQDWFYGQGLGGDQQTTDSNGQVVAKVATTTAPSIRPMTITIEGTVSDESGQYISGRSSVLAHPANIYVGLRSERYFGRENEPFKLGLIAVTPQSVPLAAQKIELSVVEIRWERIPIEGQFGMYDWQMKEIEVATDSVITGDDGTAEYVFTPSKAGIYRVRAVGRDELERVNSSSLRFWVTGQASVWWGEPSDTVDLIADKDSYQTGDTAEILVPIPFSGVSHVLMTTERAGIQTAEVFRVEGSTLIYQLPITENHVPTIYVTATAVKGTDEENLNPSYRVGQIALNVIPVNKRITVTVTPSATRAQPGDTVTLEVKTVDSHGEPVSTEVGLTVTDLAILSLMPANSGPLENTFYGQQGLYVNTQVALSALLDTMIDELLEQEKDRERLYAAEPAAMPTATLGAMDMADGMVVSEQAMAPSGGGQAMPEVTIREDFQQTPLWSPHVVTDSTGQAIVTLTLPDNLTTWRVDARGLTVETHVGQTEIDVMSTLPLLTRPVAPRFFVVGDRVTLASVINNNTDAPQTVQATLEAAGVTLVNEATQSITIPAGQRARAEWIVTVDDVPNVDLTFYAIGAGGFSDASKPTLATGPDGTIPVYRYTAPDTTGTGGVLRTDGARTEAISLPPRLDTDQGELTIKVDPSLAATTIDALDYLRNYEHQCIEQTVSRFLPNIITFRALRDLGIDDPELEAHLREALDYALARLKKEQNPDGGWGWFVGMESNPYITAYAALGLIEARNAGFDFDNSMIDRAVNFVRSQAERPTTDTRVYRLNRLAFYAYVLARGGYASERDLDLLLEYRLEMDYWAQAFLLMAYHEVNPEASAIGSLISDLQTGAILSATGGHWEEKQVDWWNWSSDTRTTALALSALARVQPNHDLLPNVVRWLMVARQGDHWSTTQETAWAVMGLTDWMVASGELEGSYDYAVTFNSDLLAEGTVTPETVREGQTLRVAVADLLKDQINRLTLIRGEGEGVLYYTAHLKTRLWASEAKPISRGITVSREYYAANTPGVPIDQAKVGDVITARVTINLSQDVYYFVLEDPIPAGTEPVDTSLLTTSQISEAPTLRPAYDPYWYWGWWYFDHTEMRDEKVNLYADFLPAGTYVYTYEVQASVPGEFQTMPSHAYAFYFPEVFGRGAGTLFTVTPAE